jgi:hypothetical protein
LNSRHLEHAQNASLTMSGPADSARDSFVHMLCTCRAARGGAWSFRTPWSAASSSLSAPSASSTRIPSCRWTTSSVSSYHPRQAEGGTVPCRGALVSQGTELRPRTWLGKSHFCSFSAISDYCWLSPRPQVP